MNDLFEVVTYPLKKVAMLLFSLEIGQTNLGSIIITGMIFAVLIAALMHGGGFLTNLFNLRKHDKDSGNKDGD